MSKKNKEKFKEKFFNKKILRSSLWEVFCDFPSKQFNYKQLAERFGIDDLAGRQLINTVLYEMVASEMITEEQTGKFKLKIKVGYITGTVDLTSKGFAYIVSEDVVDDVFVSQKNLNHSLNGDKVKVYLYAKKKSSQLEGEVVQIIERSKDTFVGTIEISNTYAFLMPVSRNMPYDIFIPFKSLNGAQNGQKVIVRLTEWPQKAKNPVGEVIDILGFAGDNTTEMHAILAEFDLPYKFPDGVEQFAENIPIEITAAEIAKRKDFRKITTFTIDPVDAKDFDDALSIQQLKNGNWEIGVHIADVTHYVQASDTIDKEAYERATSVYLVDRVVPMLPEVLSNNVCSLRPNEEKLCYSAVFEIDENANIINQWFGKTIINSDKRFTYEEAQTILENKEGILSAELLKLDELAKKLREFRFKKGAIAFEKAEVKFKLDENGKPLSIYYKEAKDSNRLIEEFMLLANRKVAELIGNPKEKGTAKTFVYRIHDKPNTDKLNSFAGFIKKFGYKIKLTSSKAIASSINQLLLDIHGKKEQNVIEALAIRSMAKAVYSTNNIGHYGLAFDHYTHFTSPIRRYPDMMVHRLLDKYLKNEKSENLEVFEQRCKHSSEMEQRAAEAERSSIKYKQVEFLKDKIGVEYDGVISGVAEWGIYVELEENKCEGLVPVRDMTDDYYVFDEENYCIIGRHTKKKYQMGDKIRVELTKANLSKKQLTFKLISFD